MYQMIGLGTTMYRNLNYWRKILYLSYRFIWGRSENFSFFDCMLNFEPPTIISGNQHCSWEPTQRLSIIKFRDYRKNPGQQFAVSTLYLFCALEVCSARENPAFVNFVSTSIFNSWVYFQILAVCNKKVKLDSFQRC